MLTKDREKTRTSWTDEACAEFDSRNDDLVMQTRALLGRVVESSATHCRMLNTLAMLEHMGSYRITVTQHGPDIEQATLRHMAEEANHAFFMKRGAEKLSGRAMQFTADDLLAGEAGRSYFRRLEARIHSELRRQHSATATYLYMSLMIEFRALWFYRLYQLTLNNAGSDISLKRILGEEAHHLSEMAHRLESAGELSNERVSRFAEIERKLFIRILDSIRDTLPSN